MGDIIHGNKFEFGNGSRMINIQVNVNSQGNNSQEDSGEKKEVTKEQLAQAIENCQEYFWGNSSYAVVFCVCRDDYKMIPNMSAFERNIELLPYKKVRKYFCKTGTITNAFSDNNIYHSHIDKWKEEGADERQIILRDELRKELVKDPVL